MQKEIIILGAGGHAKVIAESIVKSNNIIVGFLDDNPNIQGKEIFQGKKIIGKISDSYKYKDKYFVIGIGDNEVRRKLSEKYNDLKWYTVIHPSSVITNDVEIGEGTVIMPGVVINPGTKIGKHCIVNTSVTIDHDGIIEDYVHISPGTHLAGNVTIKQGTWLCIGAIVINNITIAENNVIGAGSVVVKNIDKSNGTYVGVPTKKIK